MDDLLREAMLAVDQGDREWALALATALSAESREKAFHWAVAVLEANLPSADDPCRHIREQWIADLRTAMARELVSSERIQRAREIWYTGLRDQFQTAVARAHEALALAADGEMFRFARLIAATVELATCNASYRPEPMKAIEAIRLIRERSRPGP